MRYKTKPELILLAGTADIIQIPEIKVRLNKGKMHTQISSVASAASFLKRLYGRQIETQEQIIILYVDQANNVIGYYKHTVGTNHSTQVDTQLIKSIAIKSLAKGIILSHNHPSGTIEPSKNDIDITIKLNKILENDFIALIDHIIITKNNGYYSFLENRNILKGLSGMETITTKNYFEKRKSIDFSKLPVELKQGDELLSEATDNGKSWSLYNSDKDIKEVIDLYLDKLNQAVPKFAQNVKKVAKTVKKSTKTATKYDSKDKNYMDGLKVEIRRSSKTGKNFIVWDLKIDMKFANEKFKTTTEAKQFIKLNNMELVNYPKSIEKTTSKKEAPIKINKVELISDDVKIIKSYALLDGKTKTKQQILNLLKRLQKAITEKKITKKSKHSDIIDNIQDNLIKVYNAMPAQMVVEIKPENLKKYKDIAIHVGVMESVTYLKRYINMIGKESKEKAQKLLRAIDKALELELIADGDTYYKPIKSISSKLQKYVSGQIDKLSTTEVELAGIGECCVHILTGYKAKEFATRMLQQYNRFPYGTKEDRKMGYFPQGKEYVAFDNISNRMYMTDAKTIKDAIAWIQGEEIRDVNKKSIAGLGALDKLPTGVMQSTQFSQCQLAPPLEFTGDWLHIIGKPSEPCSIMIYGKPGSGKSTVSIKLAKYLAEKHNKKTLYVASEEKKGYTLQEKVRRLNAAHPNLYLDDKLPTNPSDYKFIFLDSVNNLKLSPEMLRDLIAKNKDVSFVFVFQSTKDGDYRGSQEFAHDADVVLKAELLEPMKAIVKTEKSRFGGSGSVSIF